MKEIKINNNTYFFVEVPDDAKDFELLNKGLNRGSALLNICWNNEEKCVPYMEENNPFKLYEETDFKIISTTKDITEEQAESIVEKFEQKIGWRLDGDTSKLNSIVLFQNYKYEKPVPVTFLLSTAKESLQSLIQANMLDVNKNYLILKKL